MFVQDSSPGSFSLNWDKSFIWRSLPVFLLDARGFLEQYRFGAMASPDAGMVELVDAADSKSAARKGLRVQVSLPVPLEKKEVACKCSLLLCVRGLRQRWYWRDRCAGERIWGEETFSCTYPRFYSGAGASCFSRERSSATWKVMATLSIRTVPGAAPLRGFT